MRGGLDGQYGHPQGSFRLRIRRLTGDARGPNSMLVWNSEAVKRILVAAPCVRTHCWVLPLCNVVSFRVRTP
jgi:hypothetical protein